MSAPCPGSIFGPALCCPPDGADGAVTFYRSTLKLAPALQQPYLNSAGETTLSFVSYATYFGSVQPAATHYVRFIQGIVVQVNYRVLIIGFADVIEGDRATIEGHRVEVINSQHWGRETTEIDFRFLGR